MPDDAPPPAAPTPAALSAPTGRVTALFSESSDGYSPLHAILRAYRDSSAEGKEEADTAAPSRQQDPFRPLYAAGQILEPPFSYGALCHLLDASDALQAAVSAMEVNIAGFGLQFVPAEGAGEPADRKAAEAEAARLSRWFRYASAKCLSWTQLARHSRVDYEVFGDAYWELLTDAKGRLAGIEHLPTFCTRKTVADKDQIKVERWVRGENGWEKRTYWRRFRRFVQSVGGVMTWFKEWGDPRPIRWDDGRIDKSAKPKDLASGVLNFCQYAPDSPYGKPRWRGAAADVAGRTAAAEINSDTFDNKGIPPLLISVTGALLPAGAAEKIQQHFASARGRSNWHVPMILEVAGGGTTPTDDGPQPAVKVDVKDLTGAMQKDALFSNYRKEAALNIGLTFRLPPLYMGSSLDYTRATAEAAKDVGEEQVFAPERAEVDEVINRVVLPELGAVLLEVKSKGPPLLSEELLVQLINAGVAAGTLTPANVAKLIAPLLGIELSRPEAWAAIPTRVLDAMMKTGWVPTEGVDGLEKQAAPAPPPAPGATGSTNEPADGGAGEGSATPADGTAAPTEDAGASTDQPTG